MPDSFDGSWSGFKEFTGCLSADQQTRITYLKMVKKKTIG